MAIFHRVSKGDLALKNGDLLVLRGGAQEVRQRIMRRFRFFRGEWFLDVRVGVPHFHMVLGRNPNVPAIKDLFRRVVLSTPGVISLPSFDALFDDRERSLTFEFRALVHGGEVQVKANDPGFVFDAEGMQWAE